MSVKRLLLLPFLAATLCPGAASSAAAERASMLGAFDLKSAVLSPVPFGPPSRFQSPPVVARPAPVARRGIGVDRPRKKTSTAARKPKINPLDSYARDVRRQSWPCAGGGICAWTQPR